ncbi:hypothetical protein AJ79_04014 [Helicocarpus griseus UAMH5409]|uniref:Protein ZIP4 homolog n=1 Tax=Helicocarpus griseus UAMH5409 TaxID=1447875 RepID=A0A2B7XUW4_9EURO|nr:hypothetical protein AJ79_04014 [Helicocarpus griseus UAMH5409]
MSQRPYKTKRDQMPFSDAAVERENRPAMAPPPIMIPPQTMDSPQDVASPPAMPPSQVLGAGKTKQALDFGTFFYNVLVKYTEGDDKTMFNVRLDTLDREIQNILRIQPDCSSADGALLDAMGTKLWNMCTRLIRGSSERGNTLVVLHSGLIRLHVEKHANYKDTYDDNIRLLKVALTTARGCLDVDQLDNCLLVLGKAAAREETLSKRNQSCVTDDKMVSKYSTEYYILRMILSWRQDQRDVTEYMFSQIDMAYIKFDPNMAARFAGVLYDIGKFMLSQGESLLATQWLQRAHEALPKCHVKRFSSDVGELRLSILIGRVRAYLVMGRPDSQAIVGSLLETLDREHGNRLPVIVLMLDAISREASPNCPRYHEKLCLMVRTVSAAKSNFELITRYIRRLKKWSPELAVNAQEQLLLQRLILHNDISLLERCFVTYIWMQTELQGLTAGLDALLSVAEKLNESLQNPLSEEATHASLVLLWKKASHAFEKKEFDITEKWCLLARHPIFQNAGEANKCKIRRRLMLCALGKSDTTKVRQMFNEMSEDSRSESLTHYLMYRVALLDKDVDLARNCLEALSKQDKGLENYILACVAEARHTRDNEQVSVAQRVLLDMLGKNLLDGVHLPVLLRFIIVTLVDELKNDGPRQSEIIETICKVFEISSENATKKHVFPEDNPFSQSELTWFSRSSYNLAVEYCTDLDPQHILSLVNTCIKFIYQYPDQLSLEEFYDIALRRLLCHFLGASLSIAQARLQTDTEAKRGYYIDTRNHIQNFRGTLCGDIKTPREDHYDDLLKKHRTLLVFDFEAAVRLGQWESLSEIIEESASYADDNLYGSFSDAIFCSDVPVENSSRVLQQIITNMIRCGQAKSVGKISRWIRCHFKLGLYSDVEMAESVLDQAYVFARDSHAHHQQNEEREKEQQESQTAPLPNCYPEEELEWLSTTTFNRAVDFYAESNDEASRRWGQKAVDLAGLMHDGGSLYRVLKEKFEGLRWE